MKLQDIISMELFQQYLAETFPEDSKHGAVQWNCTMELLIWIPSLSYALMRVPYLF